MKVLRKGLLLIYRVLNFLVLRVNRVRMHGKVDIRGIVVVSNSGKFEVGHSFKVNSSMFFNVIGGDTRSSFVVKPGAVLRIGNNVSISNSSIYCADNIEIGDYVMIGGSCMIWDTDFHPLDPEVRRGSPNENYKTSPIRIGESVFIGGGCIILKGANIGDRSIIGAGSVVRGDIPQNEIWAGNPAKFIKKLHA